MSKEKVKAENFAFVFAYSVLAVIWLLPRFLSLNHDLRNQIVGYIGGFLLAVEVIGERRKAALDAFLTKNIERIESHLRAIVTSFLLIKDESQDIDPEYYNMDERAEMAGWYIFSLIDLGLLIWFMGWGCQWMFGTTVKEVASRIGWLFHLIYLVPILTGFIMLYFPRPFRKAFWYPWTVMWAASAIFFAWITIPWLLFVILTFILFKAFTLLVRLKRRFQLGNVFVMLGFVMVLYCFVSFVAKNI